MSMENNKKVVISGPLMPSTKDTPIDVRTRVESLEDIPNIQLPYVGMVFYVKSEGKHYTVKSLKAKDLNGILVEDALIDQYEEFGTHIDLDLSEFATEELVEELAAEMRENDADIREMIESIADGNGLRGEDGKSAYEIAKEFGFEGSEEEWLESLKGEQGPAGEMGPQGLQGEVGPMGPEGPMGPQGEKGEPFRYEDFTPEQLEDLVKNIESGADGKSAYEIAKEFGFEGSEEEWLESLRGSQGEQGPQGPMGPQGYSAYAAWKALPQNANGTVEEFIESLRGPMGPQGEKGEQGPQGEVGPMGPQGPAGEKGEAFKYEDFTPEQLEKLVGPQGPQGERGFSAYQAWKTLEGNEKGTVEEFIESLKGEQGPRGEKGEKGEKGEAGLSAYMLAKTYDGFEGSMQEWLDTLVGPQGPEGPAGPQGEKGEKGDRGLQGENGLSAYMLAKTYDGFEGSLPEWLDSLKGPAGPQGPKGEPFKYEDFTEEQIEELIRDIELGTGGLGKSAYEIAKEHGFKGTEEEWLESLKGEQGPQGEKGEQGEVGPQGPAGEQGPQGEKGEMGPVGPMGPQGEKGEQGEVGPQGPAGEQGPQGEKGEMGPVGPMGPQGEKGEQGEVGPQGPQGIQGEDGIGVESMLIDEGHLYVTLTNGQLIDAGEIPVNGEGGGSNPEVDKELAATKAELLETRQKLADLTYGVEYEWIYFYEQSSAGSDKLGFNQETAPKFYEDWLPVLETGDDALIEEFIMKVYEEDIYRMYVLRISSEHRLYNRYELIPVEAHSKQPEVSNFIKKWNPTGALTSWNWGGEEDGGFTIDALPSSPLVFAFMKVKEEFRIK